MDGVLAGRYELEVSLGRGGSGEVWRGRDMATNRSVAIKLVELSVIDDPGLFAETIERFRREAAVLSGLKHPNILGALDAGRFANQLFMVMDLAPGISLASMMDERGARGLGLFPVSSVLRLAEQVCAGLAAAHESGVVHRDIKPSNLMVTPQLGVKIIDFGVARLLADNTPRLTLPADTVGAIAYMSPEQAQGFDVDGRADLYSLGCVLYQLLSGRTPFFSPLPAALLMMQVMDRPTPLSVVRPDLPAALADLVSDLTEKEPSARPATAAQVISRIQAIEGTLAPEAPEHEADRETIGADDHGEALSGTRRDEGSWELGRSAVLTQERMAVASVPDTVAVPQREPVGRQWAPAGPPARQSAPFSVPFQPGPPGSAAPQAASGRGNPVPDWSVMQPGARPRPGWRGIVSTLVTAAIVAGVGAYLWEREHQTLKITNVNVTAANPRVGCDGTADIIGTISTNGHDGTIRYQWVENQEAGPAQVLDDANGSKKTQAHLKWPFHSVGTGKNVAQLRVLAPGQDESSITFPYSCPK